MIHFFCLTFIRGMAIFRWSREFLFRYSATNLRKYLSPKSSTIKWTQFIEKQSFMLMQKDFFGIFLVLLGLHKKVKKGLTNLYNNKEKQLFDFDKYPAVCSLFQTCLSNIVFLRACNNLCLPTTLLCVFFLWKLDLYFVANVSKPCLVYILFVFFIILADWLKRTFFRSKNEVAQGFFDTSFFLSKACNFLVAQIKASICDERVLKESRLFCSWFFSF